MMNNRCALLVVNPSRDEAVSAAHELSKFLMKNNFALYTISDLEIEGVTNRSIESLEEVEVVVVVGSVNIQPLLLETFVEFSPAYQV